MKLQFYTVCSVTKYQSNFAKVNYMGTEDHSTLLSDKKHEFAEVDHIATVCSIRVYYSDMEGLIDQSARFMDCESV